VSCRFEALPRIMSVRSAFQKRWISPLHVLVRMVPVEMGMHVRPGPGLDRLDKWTSGASVVPELLTADDVHVFCYVFVTKGVPDVLARFWI